MLSVVVPTYNEKNNIEPLLRHIKASLEGITEYEVVFVDDSTDETPQVIEGLCRQYGNVALKHRTEEKGLASAVVCGFELARGDVLAVMDADLQHPPDLLATMYEAVETGADVVLPSRYISGGKDEGLSFFRKLASTTARLTGKLFLKSLRRISDPTSGFFMLRREVITAVKLRPVGWKILMEILVMGRYSRVVEVPYAFQKRRAEASKINFKVTLLYFIHIVLLIVRSERERRFYLFLLVGLSGVAVDMSIYRAVSARWQLHVNIAATISAFCAMLSNYLLNRNLTWKSVNSRQRTQTAVEFLKYAGVSTIGILIKNQCVFILYLSGVSGAVSNFLGIASASLFNYFLSDKWVFRQKKSILHENLNGSSQMKG